MEDGFGITDHLNNAQTAQPLTPLVAKSVPESSSSIGLLALGAFGAGSLLKRKQGKAKGVSFIASK